MANPFLSILAGAGEGLGEAEKLHRAGKIEDRKLKLQEAEIADREEERKNKGLQAQIKVIDDAFTAIADSAPKMVEKDGLTEEVAGALSDMRRQVRSLYGVLEERGAVPGGTANARLAAFDAKLKGALTPTEKAVAEANAAVIKERTMEVALGKDWEPPFIDKMGNLVQNSRKGEQRVLAAADKPNEFERLIAKLPPDQQEGLKRARLEALVTPAGFQLTTNTDGTFTLSQGPAKVSGNQMQDLRLEAASLDGLTRDIEALMQAQREGKINLGLSGTVARGVREGVSILGDVQSMVPGLKGMNERANSLVQNLLGNDSAVLDKLKKDDPKIGELSPLETALGVAMARLNQPSGRMLADVLKKSMEDAKLTGFRSEQQVTERLGFILGKIQERRANIATELKETPAAPKAGPAAPAAPAGKTPAAAPPAPTDPAQRQKGTTYQTPRGPLRWEGTGWAQP